MKTLCILLTLVTIIFSPTLVQAGTEINAPYTSYSALDRDKLIDRESGVTKNGEKTGPTEPVVNVSLSVGSPAELDNVDSYNNSLLFYYDGQMLHVATRLYGPDDAMKSGQKWYLGGYAKKAFEMKVTGDVGTATMPLVPGVYTLYHWVGSSTDPTWTWPLWSCPAYGLRVGGNGDEFWGYQIEVLPSGQVVTHGGVAL